MSSSDRGRSRLAPLALGMAAACLLATSACTVRPLYGQAGGVTLGGEAMPQLAELKGRIDVAPVIDRTSQIVRNALLFGFNGGETPVAPLYKISFAASGAETVVSIQQGSGVPGASLYKMYASFTVTRTTDAKVVATGRRFADAPFDRSRQLFAASRAFRDAQGRAGRDLAEQIRLVALGAISRDLPKLSASVPAGKS